MAFSKNYLFSEEEQLVARAGKILGHAARVNILRRLLFEGELKPGELSGNMLLAQPTFSQHLRYLRKEGIIKYRLKSDVIYYFINQFHPCFSCIAEELTSHFKESTTFDHNAMSHQAHA